MKKIKPIALFDLDDTLADYSKAIFHDMEAIRSPSEPQTVLRNDDESLPHERRRRLLIRSHPGWWAKLEKWRPGFDVLGVSERLGFKTHILTKGPWTCENAWTEKFQWVKKHIGPDTSLSVTTDKGLTYGNFLVDDYPDYVTQWLHWRPRGWVIMPANYRNVNFTHPQVIRYDGSNLPEVEAKLTEIMKRIRSHNAVVADGLPD